MQGFRSALGLLLCAGASAMAWEAPTQHEWDAMQGREPFEEIAKAGIPLPPSRAEAMSASPLRYGQERVAVKYALACRMSVAKAARNRISPELNKTTAELARHCGAPALFCKYLELMAGQRLSRRQEYELRQAFDYLVREVYEVDTLQMRVFSESLSLPEKQHLTYMLSMPVAFMFDQAPEEPPARETLMADVRTMTTVLRKCNEILGKVTDGTTADAAAEQLKSLLSLWNTTLRVRAHAHSISVQFLPHEKLALQLLDSTSAALIETRRRLHGKQWFGSARLFAMDELFHWG